MQEEYDKLTAFANQNEMIINDEKTKAMLFNWSRTKDFMPQILNGSGKHLEVVEDM